MVAETPILVVDDDAASGHVIEQTLLAAGLTPVIAPSGSQALAWLSAHRPAVVLLDLGMLAEDGYTVLDCIRQNPQFADIPVVVLTALESDQEVASVFASGADDYVHKPLDADRFIVRVKAVLRRAE